MGLNLTCQLCGRRQVGGLLSAATWGHLDGADGPVACPTCVEEHADWRDRLAAATANDED